MMKAFTGAALVLAASLFASAQPASVSFDAGAKTFRLDGGATTYVFGVNPRGELQQLYWGGRLAASDAFPQAAPMPEWASFDSSTTTTPQEYAGWGAGLFVEPALKVSFADGNRDLVLHYQSHTVTANAFDVLLKDIDRPLYVTLHYAIDPDTGILARSATIENRGKEPLTIEQAAPLTSQTLDQRLAELRRPEVRVRILSEPAQPDAKNALGAAVRNFGAMFQLGDPPDYEQPPEASIAAEAKRRGVTPEELVYDLMLERDGHNLLYLAMANYAEGKLDAPLAMLRHRDVVPGLGDGGAHCGTICDGSYSTYLLSHFVRDRTRGEHLSLPDAVRLLTSATADVIGLKDRGLIASGYKADINVIDFDRLRLHPPEIVGDLPSGGRRLIQRADGYDATIVNGQVTYRDGIPTGALSGRLIRGQQAAPV